MFDKKGATLPHVMSSRAFNVRIIRVWMLRIRIVFWSNGVQRASALGRDGREMDGSGDVRIYSTRPTNSKEHSSYPHRWSLVTQCSMYLDLLLHVEGLGRVSRRCDAERSPAWLCHSLASLVELQHCFSCHQCRGVCRPAARLAADLALPVRSIASQFE